MNKKGEEGSGGVGLPTIIGWIIALILLGTLLFFAINNINFDFFTKNTQNAIDQASSDPDLAVLRFSDNPVPVNEYVAKSGTCEKTDMAAYERYKEIIKSAVSTSGLNSAVTGSGFDAEVLMVALITQESGAKWNPRAVSPCASSGIVQFIPSTALSYGLTISVKKGTESFRFTNNDQYRAFVNKENLWQNCRPDLCGKSVSPCNSCTTQYCDFEKDERFDPAKAIPASAKYLASQIKACGSVSKGVAGYNSGNCDGESNAGYTENILNKWYPRWAACLKTK